MITPAIEIAKQRKILYRKYVKGTWAKWNKSRIDYVLSKVYKKQLNANNPCEKKVKKKLQERGFNPIEQKLIPIESKGGKLQHLYIADFVVGQTIIEVDGKQHLKQKSWDKVRDVYTSQLGYKTIRIPTTDLKNEIIDSYLDQI